MHGRQLFTGMGGCSIPLTAVQRKEVVPYPLQLFKGKRGCSIPPTSVQREEYMFHSPLPLLKGKAGCYMSPWQLFKWKGNYSMPPQQFKGKSGCYISSIVVQWEEYIFHPLVVQRESWLFNPTPSCSKGRMTVPPSCYNCSYSKGRVAISHTSWNSQCSGRFLTSKIAPPKKFSMKRQESSPCM